MWVKTVDGCFIINMSHVEVIELDNKNNVIKAHWGNDSPIILFASDEQSKCLTIITYLEYALRYDDAFLDLSGKENK